MTDKKRYCFKNTLGMFDLVKGIVMIFVILFHTYGLFDTEGGYETNIEIIRGLGIPLAAFRALLSTIGSALMPILFVIGGYGFRKTPLKKYAKKQFHALIIPFCITAIVTTIVHFFVSYFMHWGWFRYSVVETLNRFAGFLFGLQTPTTIFGVYLNTCGPVWFLLALFWGNIIFDWVLLHFTGNRILIASLVISFIGWVSGLWITIPWSISQGLVAVLYICMGYLAKKTGLFVIHIRKKMVIAMVFVAICAFVMNCFEGLYMAESKYFLGPVSIVLFGLFSLVLIYLSLWLNVFGGIIINAIRKIGRLSLYVMCVHTVEIMTFGGYAHYYFANSWRGSIFARSMIIFGVRIVVVLLGMMVLLRVKEYFRRKGHDTAGVKAD